MDLGRLPRSSSNSARERVVPAVTLSTTRSTGAVKAVMEIAGTGKRLFARAAPGEMMSSIVSMLSRRVAPVWLRRLRVIEASPPQSTKPVTPWLERAVREGVASGTCAVRMAVKNRLIVAVLRDDMPCDTAALKAEAHLAFLAVAREYELTAARLGEENTSVAAILDPEGRDSPEFEEARGPRIYLLLAAALRTAGGDYEQITGVVERARNDAWLEVGREIRSRRITANRSTLGSAQHESPRHQDLA